MKRKKVEKVASAESIKKKKIDSPAGRVATTHLERQPEKLGSALYRVMVSPPHPISQRTDVVQLNPQCTAHNRPGCRT